MDKERKKRLRTYRLILTESLMFLTVVLMVIVLLFVAMGYKFGLDGSFNQTGLLQIDSMPTGATVTIDGDEMFARTNMSKMLSEDKHTVKLTKDGYESWENTVKIKAGILYRLDYPRLFKQNRESEIVKEFESRLGFLSASTNRTSLLYANTDDTVWNLASIRGDDVATSEINVAPYFRLNDSEEVVKIEGEIDRMEWNNDGDKVLVEWKNGDIHDFILINVRNPDASLNLTETFGMEFTDVKMANDSAERLLVLENGNLRKISVPSKEISSVLVSGVEEFGNLEMSVVYVTIPNEAGEKTIGLYREGEKNVVILTTISGSDVAKATVSEYLGEKYIGLSINDVLYVYSGDYPMMDKSLSEMKEVAKQDLTEIPDELYAHDKGRFIVAKKDKKIVVFNAELGEMSGVAIESSRMNWMDPFLIANVTDGKLVERDFDGANRRVLADASSGYDSVISANNKWLYYVAEHGTKLKRERL